MDKGLMTRQGCASRGTASPGYAAVTWAGAMMVDEAGGAAGRGAIASPTSIAKPTTARKAKKNSANRTSEMRLATAEALVKPSAPAISEMIKKMTAYLNM